MSSHDSALTHVTGRSEFVDDRPILANELFLALLYSDRAHAELKGFDFNEALKIKGVIRIFTAADFPHLYWGTIFQDQPLLAQGLVQYAGEPIAIIAATQLSIALEARTLCKVKYADLKPVRTIDQAITQKNWIGPERAIKRGDFKVAFENSPYKLKSEIRIAGQDHFYLENQAAIAYPTDFGGIEIHSSSQHPSEVQHLVAHSLGIPNKDVTCIVKRMGGAFGGKESQAAPFAAYAALVAHTLKCPARMVLNKDDDMIITGKRNPFWIKSEVGFDEKGKILALKSALFSDGGAYADLSTAIMERAMLHIDNSYFIPNVSIKGQVCKTNSHPHTAFRGFGGPKGVAAIEKIIEEIAEKLGMDALDVRLANVYREGFDVTPYGQKIENNCLPELFAKLIDACKYRKRREEIEKSKIAPLQGGLARGLSLTAVKFGISFTTRFLNQGNALVIIHRDGTVQVSTGATEMGQGVNSRIAKIVADAFGLSVTDVRVMPTSTEKNANTSPTAASSGTDINGSAALLACEKLIERLSSVAIHLRDTPRDRWAVKTAGLGTEKEADANLTREVRGDFAFEGGYVVSRDGKFKIKFSELVVEAYLNRVSLSEYAHYKVPGLTFNKLTGQGEAFGYFTQGVAATEVSVCSQTGEIKVLRTDILMDLGRPINRDLDIGQITGGFVQGMGWVTTENLFYDQRGMLLSHAPSTYKIPNIQDTPRIFNVDLIENHGNIRNVKGTKAVGEPPLLLSISVWTAVTDALRNLGVSTDLAIPATSEAVLRKIWSERFRELD